MKFLSKEYEPQMDDDLKLRARIATLQEHLSPKQTIHLTLVTTIGLKHNAHSGIFQQVVTLDQLFWGVFRLQMEIVSHEDAISEIIPIFAFRIKAKSCQRENKE